MKMSPPPRPPPIREPPFDRNQPDPDPTWLSPLFAVVAVALGLLVIFVVVRHFSP